MASEYDKQKRSKRRANKVRMKDRAATIYNYDGARSLGDHIKNCSCDMCCNPRHSDLTKGRERLTMQERRAVDNQEDQEDFLDEEYY